MAASFTHQVRARKDGGKLYFTRCEVPSAKSLVGIVHGYADHRKRYSHVQEHLAEKGYSSLAIDLRGHGDSEGDRGYVERFDEYLDDLAMLKTELSDVSSSLPKILLAHSNGGLLATYALARGEDYFQTVLLSSPFLGLALKVPGWKRVLGEVASQIAPKLGVPSGLTGAAVTHDPVKAKAYDTDPLVFKKAKARWFTEAGRAQQESLERASSIKTPCAILFGSADPVADFNTGKSFFASLGSARKEFIEAPGLFHEVLNEPEWKTYLDKLLEFAERA